MKPRRIVIVGGVAGGASAATRARRLSEDAEIVVLERGPYVSFANCGLPYFVGGEIEERERLLVQTPESLRALFNLDVRSEAERRAGSIPGSVHIPLPQLRTRLDELPSDREIIVHCQSGQRSYNACRLLIQCGFRARNLVGSYRTWLVASESADGQALGTREARHQEALTPSS
jgi:rhodanese-related sulfurtransferase